VTDWTPITGHVEEGLALLLDQYQDQPRIEALLTTYLEQVQALEDVALAVYTLRMLDIAADAQLDTLGAIVGEERNGRADASYRRAIRVRILINNSDGRAEQLAQIADLFEGVVAAGGSVDVRDYPPASILVTVHGHTFAEDPEETVRRLRQAKGAGIGLQLIHEPSGSDATTFTLGDSSSPTTGDGSAGLGSTTETTGGFLSGVV
jgi:hypothetical protein